MFDVLHEMLDTGYLATENSNSDNICQAEQPKVVGSFQLGEGTSGISVRHFIRMFDRICCNTNNQFLCFNQIQENSLHTNPETELNGTTK